MGRIDKDTQEFFEKLSSEEPTRENNPVRQGFIAAKVLTQLGMHRPDEALRTAARLGTAKVTRAFGEEEKLASLHNPLEIYAAMNEKFGKEWFDWEPETIWKSIGGEEIITDEIRNIILALQVLVNTNFAHEEWHVFENTCHAFNHNDVDFATLQPCELNEIARTIKIINTIRPNTDLEAEVDGYIASCAKHSGVVYLPEDMFGKGVQEALDKLNNDLELRDEVKAAWPREPKTEDSLPLKIQLMRLQEIKEYA